MERISFQQWRWRFMNSIDPRCPRTLLQFTAQCVVLLGSTGGHYFNAAIFAVAHPSPDPRLRRFALDKPPKPYTLDASSHNVAASFKIGYPHILRVTLRDRSRIGSLTARGFPPSQFSALRRSPNMISFDEHC